MALASTVHVAHFLFCVGGIISPKHGPLLCPLQQRSRLGERSLPKVLQVPRVKNQDQLQMRTTLPYAFFVPNPATVLCVFCASTCIQTDTILHQLMLIDFFIPNGCFVCALGFLNSRCLVAGMMNATSMTQMSHSRNHFAGERSLKFVRCDSTPHAFELLTRSAGLIRLCIFVLVRSCPSKLTLALKARCATYLCCGLAGSPFRQS